MIHHYDPPKEILKGKKKKEIHQRDPPTRKWSVHQARKSMIHQARKSVIHQTGKTNRKCPRNKNIKRKGKKVVVFLLFIISWFSFLFFISISSSYLHWWMRERLRSEQENFSRSCRRVALGGSLILSCSAQPFVS